MPTFPNFYERIDEAKMRLRGTVVLYEDEPYYVLAVTDHKSDGKFRIYLDPLSRGKSANYTFADFPRVQDYHCPGQVLDIWLDANPDKGVIRKYMGAAGFNKYRPFPLGNMNYNGTVYYCERSPTRNTFQGLRREAVICMPVSVSPDPTSKSRRGYYDAYTEGRSIGVEFEGSLEFYDCIKGNYPTFAEVVEALRDPDVTNVGVAFHREFSVFRGPLDMLFLCYQHQGIGQILDKGKTVILSKEYEYLLESVQDLGVFKSFEVLM